ncbi:GNAT family N-acetyltransferase [uncultured Microbacterium sp.]|uniref:GNAT family N-acetyltransferase n=1 Tax=uncultured Microbacterium sp. TaxID=191216 RepID=UPI0025D9C9D8|nr:GNAT family N-acetyltransferase [uncultured Microbacterium sp.]
MGDGDREGFCVVPANRAAWDDLQTVLTGSARRCQCERQRLGDRDWWPMSEGERAALLRGETHCGDPSALGTTGLLGFLDGEPVAWCAVDQRRVYARLRGSPVPWKGRDEDPDDEGVWAIACLIVRPGFRGRGLTYPMVEAGVEHARRSGARVVEGYPLRADGANVPWGEMNVGSPGAFLAAGFFEVARPTVRRVVMRREL